MARTGVARGARSLAALAVLFATVGVVSAASAVADPAPVVVDFSYTGDAQPWVVPIGVTSLTVEAWGAGGGRNGTDAGCGTGDGPGDAGGLGGYARGAFTVTPGESLSVVVGGMGGAGTSICAPFVPGGAAGWNGGGPGGSSHQANGSSGGGGGGGSDVRTSAAVTDRIIAAGGGGGGGGGATGALQRFGGAGGGATGAPGLANTLCSEGSEAGGGGGGTGGQGGAGGAPAARAGAAGGDGALAQGGSAGMNAGGGGGGGYYGGGGGGGGDVCPGSGGGGSGFVAGSATDGLLMSGVRAGEGLIRLTYVPPSPDTQITTSPPSLTSSTSASFSFSDPTGVAASFACSLDGGPFSPCASPTTYSGLTDQGHSFAVEGLDATSNADPSPASYSWRVDAVAPIPTIDSGPPLTSPGTAATFTFHADDAAATFTCALDAGPATLCTSPTTYTGLSDGAHTFILRAADAAGNVSPPAAAVQNWTVDTSAPDTTITSAPPTVTSSPSATLQFSAPAADAATGFRCSLDGAAFADCSSPVTVSSLTDGSHSFAVAAVDALGHVDPTPATTTWSVDTIAPDTAITAQPDDPTKSTDATFTFAAADGGTGVASLACALDGALFTPCTSPLDLTGLGEGTHTFAVAATDGAGNTDLTPATARWTTDATAPTIQFTGGPHGSTTETSATIDFTVTDPTAVTQTAAANRSNASPVESAPTATCALDHGTPAACDGTVTFTNLAVGSHALVVAATDAAGNIANASWTWTVVAAVPPTTTTAAPSTTTTTAPLTTGSTAVVPVSGSLPFTGRAPLPLVVVGVGLALSGMVLVTGRRILLRRRDPA